MRYIFLTFFALIFFLGCESRYEHARVDSNVSKNIPTELKSSFLEYWELYSNKSFEDSYDYELPYQRFIYSKQWYLENFRANNKNYSVTLLDIELDQDNKRAILKARYESDTSKFVFKDPWFLVENRWYHKFNPSKLPTAKDYWLIP